MKAGICAISFALLTIQLLIAAPGRSQGMEKEITLGLQKENLSVALKKIEELSGFRIAYAVEDVEKYTRISLPKAKRTVERTLELVLAETILGFRTQNDAIIIYQSPPSHAGNTATLPEVADTIRGKVLNDRNEPVESASILVKGSQSGTFTNARGEFVLHGVERTATIVVSAVGYGTQELALNGRAQVSIQITGIATGMEEVVVTALGISRKTKSLSYATQSVKPSTLTEVRDPNNVLNSLQGKIANALITQSSGGLGSDAKVILRGNRSITGNSSALIVVDGIPGGDPGINPDNIESMTVLSGSSGAALYGSQAGNGVIVITTKKGRKDGITVGLNSGITAERPFALPRVQNTYGQGFDGKIDGKMGDSWGEKMTGQSYTDYFGNQNTYSAQPDNIRDFFRTGINLNNAVSISGGSEKAQTYLSYINITTQGIIPNNNLVSHIVNFRITNQISKKFSTDAKVTYHRRDIKASPRAGESNTPVMDIYQIPRNVSTAMAAHYQDINNIGVPVLAPWPSTVNGVYSNPYWEVNNDRLDKARNNVIGFLKAKYQALSWLGISASANIDTYNETQEQKILQGTVSWARNAGGYYAVTNTYTMQKWFDIMLEGNNNITKDLKISYHAGAIYKDNKADNTNDVADGLNVTNKFSMNLATTPVSKQSGSQVRVQSLFGLATLSLKDYLFLEGSFRNDWDSRLPPPHSFSYYSAGLSGIISEMTTMPSSINFLKAFVSYSEVGNGGQFGLLTTPYDYVAGAGQGYLYRRSVFPFPTLKPEIVRSIEAGIDARFLDSRLGISVNYYKSNSFNQLLNLQLPVGSGYTSSYLNAGNIQNNGVEVIVNGSPVRSKNLGWDISFNIGLNKNKVIELSPEIKSITLVGHTDFGGQPQINEGGSFGDIYANTWLKNDKGQYLVTDLGKPVTSNSVGQLPSLVGNFSPKATLGLSNTLHYKKFSLRVLIDGRVGGTLISGTEMNISYSGITEETMKYREGGLNLGGVNASGAPVTATISAQDFWRTASGKRRGTGEFYAYDATNFRVRELSLGYDIPVTNSFIKSAKISAMARNLLWLYRGSSKLDIPGLGKRKMWMDPDMSLNAGNSYTGVEYGVFPSTRSIGFNLQLTF
ncbi:MAG: SusC/RagA family TonB-linked outer membrane protein [Chitinophagaceae bacterium]|nr:SusC/RagA family TonB-linked outer membrane protein [Chitinophagaceae bacterium]